MASRNAKRPSQSGRPRFSDERIFRREPAGKSHEALVQPVADFRKGRRQFTADRIHGADDDKGNASGDDAVFDGRSARLVMNEFTDRDHVNSLSNIGVTPARKLLRMNSKRAVTEKDRILGTSPWSARNRSSA